MTSDPTENILLRRDQAIVERRSKRPDRRGGGGEGLHPKTMDMQVLCDYSVKRYRSAKCTPSSS